MERFQIDIGWFQHDVKEWAIEAHPQATNDRVLLGVFDEFGELARYHAKYIDSRTDSVEEAENFERVRHAFADAFVFLTHYCSLMGIDMEQCLAEHWPRIRDKEQKP